MTIPTVCILGIVNRVGYLLCNFCTEVTGYDHDRGYVVCDSHPHADEKCDLCGVVLKHRCVCVNVSAP